MSSEAIQVAILNRLLSIIATDYSSGFSGYDLSNKVVFGATVGPNIVPSANLTYIDTIEQQGRTLGRYVGESVFQIVCYAGGGDIKERITNSLNLGGDIQKAITIDRTIGLSGRTEDVIVNMTATDGEEYGISQCGICLLEVRITHQSQYGT
tara:strand:+ start:8799 stop:9254 length:456 start_codon:yes stop_codon:yes gene_type:complete